MLILGFDGATLQRLWPIDDPYAALGYRSPCPFRRQWLNRIPVAKTCHLVCAAQLRGINAGAIFPEHLGFSSMASLEMKETYESKERVACS